MRRALRELDKAAGLVLARMRAEWTPEGALRLSLPEEDAPQVSASTSLAHDHDKTKSSTPAPSGTLHRAQKVHSEAQAGLHEAQAPFAHAGSSMVLCDLTGDGVTDLAVGAPGAVAWRGVVHIYAGGDISRAP